MQCAKVVLFILPGLVNIHTYACEHMCVHTERERENIKSCGTQPNGAMFPIGIGSDGGWKAKLKLGSKQQKLGLGTTVSRAEAVFAELVHFTAPSVILPSIKITQIISRPQLPHQKMWADGSQKPWAGKKHWLLTVKENFTSSPVLKH